MSVRKAFGIAVWPVAAGFAVLLGLAIMTPATAQQAAGIQPQRDCQTVRTCNFARNGAVRGCLSSYTCRTCRFVPARCSVAGRTANCREMVCSWGG
jgi:hypothetical protein